MDNFNFDGFSSDSSNDNDAFDFGSGFGSDDNSSSSFDLQDNSGGIPDNAFDGAFDDSGQDFSNNDNDTGGIGKKAIILIIVGVIALILVIVLATVIPKSLAKKDNAQLQNITTQTPVNNNKVTGDASNMVSTPSNTTNNSSSKSDDAWITISDNEGVEFTSQYQTVMFTVTGVEHYAKKVDASGVLIMKTTLTGTLAGYPGTYRIDIPYEKGKKLTSGTYFNVSIQVGNYKGTTVIGDITTYLQ